MKKILYIVSTLRSSGTTTQLYDLISNIDCLNYKLFILTLASEDSNSRIQEFSEYCSVINLNIPRKYFWFSKKVVFKAINEISPDIIHSHTFRPDFINSFMSRLGYKTMSTIHSHSGEFFKYTYGYIGYLFFKTHKNSLCLIDKRVACSKSVASYTEVKMGCDSEVVYNGTEIRYSIDEINHLIKKRIKNKKTLIYIGSLTDLKNIVFLIEGFIIFNKNNMYELLLVGDGPLLEYANQFTSYGVSAVGNTNDVYKYLENASIFVSASKSEGMPMAVIEAMSLGLPVLLSNIPSHKEIFDINADIGCIFENNIEDFLNKLTKLLQEDYLKLSTSSYELARDVFSAKNMSRSYQKIYEEL